MTTTLEKTDTAVQKNDCKATTQKDVYTAPLVDIYEKDDRFVIVADMPGLEPNDIELTTENNMLKIKGTTQRDGKENAVWREFRPSGYYREFKLGNRINQEAISAEYRHGVLTLTLPYTEESKPRQIEIKAS